MVFSRTTQSTHQSHLSGFHAVSRDLGGVVGLQTQTDHGSVLQSRLGGLTEILQLGLGGVVQTLYGDNVASNATVQRHSTGVQAVMKGGGNDTQTFDFFLVFIEN